MTNVETLRHGNIQRDRYAQRSRHRNKRVTTHNDT